ncbi:serine/threonine-protein kinase [Nonomuraea fuscirosea]|uniref:serine/threonine-protein kinase n=1 Tax=Nonomuraea fuscirosea TaxID=1291556 RepID=UPI0034436DB2
MSDSAVMVGGRYRLLRTIGRGGMGTVWQAHDEVLGRDVAVKEVLPPTGLTGEEHEEFAVRTFREARAAGRVTHPGVAAVYDVLEEQGHPWIVMQLVHSRTLGEQIRDEGPMSQLDVASVGLQLMEALRAAHAAGVLHRDVKPDNVLLTEDGRAVLTDFGIATTEDEAPVTRTGILIGTPSFMAPERAAGGRARPASDLWSLGVTLYMAIEGHSPFHRDNALATLGAVMHAEPEPLARAGVLAPVLMGLLRKDPSERMTLDEAEQRLSVILAGGAPEQTGPLALPGVTRRGGPRGGLIGGLSGGPSGGPSSGPGSGQSGGHRGGRRYGRALPLAAIAGSALVVAVVTGGAAWWSNRSDDLPRVPDTVPAVVGSSAPGTTPAATDPARPSSPPVSQPPERRTVPQSTVPQRAGPRSTGPRSTPPPTREQPRTPAPERSATPSREATDDKKDDKKKDDTPTRTPGQVEGQ